MADRRRDRALAHGSINRIQKGTSKPSNPAATTITTDYDDRAYTQGNQA
jgi:hypothetical protein